MFKEFNEFLLKTNALALAIGVIIGGAVGKVVSSIVSDLLMPIIGVAIPGGQWREIKLALTRNPDGTAAAALGVGPFLGSIVDFVIIALCVFLITKALIKPAAAPPGPEMKTCPECAESVLKAARKCRHCGSAV